MGFGLAGLFAGIGVTVLIAGLGLVWVARGATETETRKVAVPQPMPA
jgi:hypothetical protein